MQYRSASLFILLLALLLAGCSLFQPSPPPPAPGTPAASGSGTTANTPAPAPPPSPTSIVATPAAKPTNTPVQPTPTPSPVAGAISGKVRDAYSGNGIAGATLKIGSANATSDSDGSFRLTTNDATGTISASASGYASATVPYTGQSSIDLQLRPTILSGVVTDQASGKPVISATVYAYTFAPGITAAAMITAPMQVVSATTSMTGSYTLRNIPEGAQVTVAFPGYLGFRQDLDKQTRLDIALKPHVAKGIYMTYYAAGAKDFRNKLIDLIDRTELNTLVIDIKGDRGYTLYKSNVPMATTIGSNENPMIDDIGGFLKLMKQKNIYVVARIVTFKDNILTTARPELGIKNTKTGKPWIDNEELGWADPFQQEAWTYNRELAREAILLGFDEVQFDYIRFPTDGNLDVLAFSKENNAENRVAAITGFLDSVDREVKPLGGFISADVFGYTVFNPTELEIGQKFEEVAKRLDYISPMIYPSTYFVGIPNTDYLTIGGAVSHPYDVIYQSSKRARERLEGMPVVIRPWLQDFDDYAYDNRKYGVEEVKTQIKAVSDAGLSEWLLWSPSNEYTEGALGK